MSIFGDFFEQFRRRSEYRVPMDIPQDILNDLYDHGNLDESQRQEYHECNPNRHGTFFDNPMDFMSEFEEMFNNFFKGFPVMAFPLPNENEIPSLPGNEDTHESNTTLQEKMLNDRNPVTRNRRSPAQPPFLGEGLRRPVERPGRFNLLKEDKNLDEDLEAGGKSLDDIIPRGSAQPEPPRTFFGSFTSSSVTRNSNGVVESKKTIRDSRGNEEVTITRRSGDKEYTITQKTDEHGNKETRENVVEFGAEKKHLDMLTGDDPPVTNGPPSLYERLRSWLSV
ncbi:uncharacterized protein LOC114531315 [Dendronephthya gigantea]|uniref:uncharacterized protein LOC114531315 n=1 Tax=Dendronephthya gigantea TaxID=151771 RepID=UPI00106D9962|nr:uncharacterized protein LOC114531315 [Dendronephthya gigantea]